MSKLSSRMTAILAIVFISVFLVLTAIREKGEESFHENRPLAARPQLTAASLLDGSFTGQLSAYITDHFAGRSGWISANAQISSQLSERIVNGVYIADDMLLDTSFSGRTAYSGCAVAVNAFADRYSGALYFVAVPTSSGVYADKLPEYLLTNTEEQQISSLYSSLSAGIRSIDACNILKTLSENYIYYRNDTKWTSYGAYCVYRTVIQKLGFQPTAYDKYTIEHVSGDFKGNLYNRSQYSGIKPDILDIYDYPTGAQVQSCISTDNDGVSHICHLYDEARLGSNDMYGMYLGIEAPLIRIKTSVNNERRLLLIKDSYADCFVPFLSQHYSEIAVVSPEYMETGLSDFLDIDDYEQTLFLFGLENLYDSGIFDNLNL